ncbi:MAG: TRAP transporter large permease [Anaerovoracaceae bacterium]
MNTLLLLGLFFLFVVLKIPVAFSLILSSLIGCFVLDLAPLTAIAGSALNSLFSYPLLAIPYYIFAGAIMTRGGISKRLCDWIGTVFDRFTGGVGMVTVVACAFFAAISGSATATTASIGTMMLPEMEKQGYRRPYALSIAAAGGVLGPMIPPSIMLVLYGVSTETSIGSLFLAGFLPGVLLAFFLCGTVYLTAKKEGLRGNADSRFSLSNFGRTMWRAKWGILIPVIILGGIYGGFFTPTEAGAVCCIYAIIVSLFIERTLDFKGLVNCAAEATIVASTIFILIASAGIFGKVLTLAQVPQQMSSAILAVADNQATVLIFVNILLILIGCVMDGGAAIVILAPLLWPVVQAFGVDPIHFGVMICLNLSIGAITPPVGSCLFAASIVGETQLEKICRDIIPFLLAEVAALLVVIFVPQLSLYLVSLAA